MGWLMTDGNVYLAGCTADDTYNNEALCPRKYTLDEQQWVGMVRCFVSNDKSKSEEVWQGCRESLQPLNTIADPCTCTTGQSDGLYTRAPPDLPREAILPTKAGGSITFASGYGPSNTHVTATSKVNLTELTRGPADATPASSWTTLPGGATATGGSSAGGGGNDGGGSLSTGAKAGIGVGVGVGALAIVAILWCLFRLNQRLTQTHPNHPPAADGTTPTPMSPATPATDYHQNYAYGQVPIESPKPIPPAAAYVHPSELEGSPYQTAESELPGDNVGMYQAQMAQHGSPNQAYQNVYQGSDPNNPNAAAYHRGSDAGSFVSSARGSEYASPGYASPQGTDDGSGAFHDRSRSKGQTGQMGPIHEMNG